MLKKALAKVVQFPQGIKRGGERAFQYEKGEYKVKARIERKAGDREFSMV